MIKVFVSSTYKDLVPHRQAVMEVLQRMQTDTRAMEYFGSRPDGAEQVCAEEIDACNVLVGIYAWRYGWVPEASEVSITEQEFDRARAAGADCLCYVVDEQVAWPPDQIDKGKAASRLAKLKKKVGRLVVSKFTTPDDLAKKVAADLARLIRKDSAATAKADPLSLDWGAVPPGVRREVLERLRALPDAAVAPSIDAASAPFVARNESFGALIYDRSHNDYIPFDQDAADIFRLSGRKPLDKIHTLLSASPPLESFRRFIGLCQEINLLDAEGRYTGVFLDGPTPPKGRLSAPTIVHYACTNACNFRCGHCHSASGHPYAGELTTREACELVDALAEMGCMELVIGGGEPLVRADLAQIIKRANEHGVQVSISTNGAAATPEVIDTLRGLKIAIANVSLEGMTEVVGDEVRGEPGAHAAVLRGVENLRSLGAPIGLRRVFLRGNAEDLGALVEFANRLGARTLSVRTAQAVGRAAARPELLLDAADTARLRNQVEEQVQVLRRRGDSLAIDVLPSYSARRLFKSAGCDCGVFACHVDPLGNVRASGMGRRGAPAGNLRQRSLRAIWNDADAFARFRADCAGPRCLVREELAAAAQSP